MQRRAADGWRRWRERRHTIHTPQHATGSAWSQRPACSRLASTQTPKACAMLAC